jgi:hypothetical protein
MYSKEESAKLRKEFWISFGKSFPRKWLLYNTKIKDFAFKFVADNKKAMVCLDIEPKDQLFKEYYFDKILSLKNILKEEYISDIIFDDNYRLDNGKSICRIYTKLPKKFSIHNKNTWQDAYSFFLTNMSRFEEFFYEYEDYIKS